MKKGASRGLLFCLILSADFTIVDICLYIFSTARYSNTGFRMPQRSAAAYTW